MPNDGITTQWGTILALVIFIIATLWFGAAAQRAVSRGSFLKGYFLGNRGLGAWAIALTATVQSGGTFMGFPSLVYSYGWIVAVWIAGYMVVPLTSLGVLGKRFAQMSRRTGAITVPDMLRERFGDARVGLVGSLLILFFLTFTMVAQFKAGALVMKIVFPLDLMFQSAEATGDALPAATASAAVDDANPSPVETPVVATNAESAETPETQKDESLDYAFLVGLGTFTLIVVGYTAFGGFLASVWTDLFQSVLMLVGVIILVCIAVPKAGGLEQATRDAVAATDDGFVSGPGYVDAPTETADDTSAAPAPPKLFLPVSLAFSFFFTWVYAGMGSPSGMVRLMACSSTGTLRRSIILLAVYNMLIYIPLIMICIAGRALMPDVAKSDEIIPRMAVEMTSQWPGGSLLAGLVLAAPFGAVMATVSSYLVVIASGIVRDIYQRFIDPHANEMTIKRLTYASMIMVGVIAIVTNIRPVEFLQAIVVFCGAGQAAAFVVPGLMTAFWRRATAAGTIAAMLTGALTVVGLYATGWISRWIPGEYVPAALVQEEVLFTGGAFRPFYLLGIDPIVWGLLVSALAGALVSLATQPPKPEVISQLFDAEPATT